jgi:uncharacterized cupin superfamily protein
MRDSDVSLAVGKIDLSPGPINPEWVLEGNPVSRNTVVSHSADGTAWTVIWDCTAGRFNWSYDFDETLYVIEGSVTIRDGTGAARRVSAGDVVFFPAGSQAEWHVEKYIRKIAFCRNPMPWPLLFVKRGFRFLKRLLGLGKKPAQTPLLGSG